MSIPVRAILFACFLITVLGGAAAGAVIQGGQGGGDGPAQPIGATRGWPGQDFFPNHDPGYVIIDLTGNSYGDNQPFPDGYYLKYACFNCTGTRIAVSARNQVGGVSQPYEIWAMDYDAASQVISNFQQITTSGGTGDVDSNGFVSFSRSDPDLLLFCEVHVTTANLLKTYDFGTGTFATVYDPALDSNGFDITNPGFLGTGNTTFILGTGYGTGSDKIVAFDGTYPSVTISSPDQNLDPSSNHAGNRVTYYSTSAYYGQGSIYSQYSGGAWNENIYGFGDPSGGNVPGYWAYYSAAPDDMILSLRLDLGWSATGLGLYEADGTLLSDLLGDGGSDFQWVYANNNWQGPNGEILFRAEEITHPGYGNNMFVALTKPALVRVDDDWTGPVDCGGNAWGYNAFSSINGALAVVQDGGQIIVAAGSYEEQITIDGRTIAVAGAGKGATNILSPAILEVTFTTASDNKAVVGVINGGHLDLSGVTVDGRGYGNSNYRFAGIGMRNSSASVADCEILNIMDTPFSGAQHGVGIYAFCDEGETRQIDLIDCEVIDFQKNGVVLSGVDVTANLVRVVTPGQGPTDVTAQNGIQLAYGAEGRIDDCTASGVCYTGGYWTATGILLYDGGFVDLVNSTITDCQTGVYYIATSGTYNNNTLTAGINSHSDDGSYWGLAVDDQGPHGAYASVFGDGVRGPGLYSSKVAVTNSVFSADRTGLGTGIGAWGVAGDKAVVDVADCSIANWYWGIDVWSDGTVLPQVDVTRCIIAGNTDYGIINSTAILVTAEHNWWGHTSGPYHPVDNPSGLGDTVSDNVDFDPWLDFARPYLYLTGTPVPGGQITISVIGLPGNPVLLATSTGIKDPPYNTKFGDLYLWKPIKKTWDLGWTNSEGRLYFPAAIPIAWAPGSEKPFQALVGAKTSPLAALTNLLVITVESP